MGESFDTHRTLLIEGVFRCELERFILALAASTERAKRRNQQKKQTNKQKKEGPASCRTRLTTNVPALDPRSALIACTNTTI